MTNQQLPEGTWLTRATQPTTPEPTRYVYRGSRIQPKRLTCPTQSAPGVWQGGDR